MLRQKRALFPPSMHSWLRPSLASRPTWQPFSALTWMCLPRHPQPPPTLLLLWQLLAPRRAARPQATCAGRLVVGSCVEKLCESAPGTGSRVVAVVVQNVLLQSKDVPNAKLACNTHHPANSTQTCARVLRLRRRRSFLRRCGRWAFLLQCQSQGHARDT